MTTKGKRKTKIREERRSGEEGDGVGRMKKKKEGEIKRQTETCK